MCKIIQLPSMHFSFDKNFFVEKISVASNSQKPIKEKDLISNSYEVNNLSDKMFNHKPSLFYKGKEVKLFLAILNKIIQNLKNLLWMMFFRWLHLLIFSCLVSLKVISLNFELFTKKEYFQILIWINFMCVIY